MGLDLISYIIGQKKNEDNGLYLSFYIPSNLPKEKGTYLNGKKHREWFYWNSKGKLVKQEKWQNGKLLKKINY